LVSEGFLGIGRGWRTAHVALYRDSMLLYFSQQGDTSPDGCVELRVGPSYVSMERDIEIKVKVKVYIYRPISR
jgi:hypothetical protein